MRTCPWRSATPDEGWSYPDSRLRRVVLPQPDGPTTATNSRRPISIEISHSTSTSPNRRDTRVSCNGLSLTEATGVNELGARLSSEFSRSCCVFPYLSYPHRTLGILVRRT